MIKSCYKGTYRVPIPAPYILHTGERVLNVRQTKALDRLEKNGKIKLPKGAKNPQRVSKKEVKRIMTMYLKRKK